MDKLQIEYVPIGDIKPYERNAKMHPQEQVDQIKASIERFGMIDPIGIWKDTVVEGHGRLLACEELGMEEVPIIRLDQLTDEERRAYMLAHNKLNLNTGFDNLILDMELEEITGIDMGQFGFDAPDMNIDLDGIFTDAPEKEKKPKVVTCPHCGQTFEVE